MDDTPSAPATSSTLRVEMPSTYISATAATSARSARQYRSMRSSGKNVPVLSFGILTLMSPAGVSRPRSR